MLSGNKEGISERLRNFSPDSDSIIPVSGKPVRILHLLSQQPGKTGSGIALKSAVKILAEKGYIQRTIVGIPSNDSLPEIEPLESKDIFAVRFGAPPVPFPIPGMSDFMPYPSIRFSSFTPEMLEGYLMAFETVLQEAVNGFYPDIIHSNHLWLLTALCRMKFPLTPVCVSSHGTELRQLVNAPHLSPYVIRACKAVDRVFALHDEDRKKIIETYGIDPCRIKIIGSGFRDDIFGSTERCEPASSRNELTITYAGKISPPKGVPWLIEAMRFIKPPKGKRVKLLLAGSSSDDAFHSIRNRAADLENVFFLGGLSQEELARVFCRSDVFVLPSFFEGLPLVLLESLACGCRVVTTNLPGIDSWMPRELIEDGFVEPVPLPRLIGPDRPDPHDLPKFVSSLAEAVTRQLERAGACDSDVDFSCRIAPLSWKEIVKKIEAGYRELIPSSQAV
ncbi:MAG: glycosyltransferase family 4 protein [Thermodesulfobacteriota bacterium]